MSKYFWVLTWAMFLSATAHAFEGRDYQPSMNYPSEWACRGEEKFNWYCEAEQKPASATQDEKSVDVSETKEEKAQSKKNKKPLEFGSEEDQLLTQAINYFKGDTTSPPTPKKKSDKTDS